MKKPSKFLLSAEKFFEPFKNYKKILWILGEYIFFVILAVIIIEIIFGAGMLYRYAILAQKNVADNTKTFEFNEQAYNETLSEIKVREEKFASEPEERYEDPFKLKDLSGDKN